MAPTKGDKRAPLFYHGLLWRTDHHHHHHHPFLTFFSFIFFFPFFCFTFLLGGGSRREKRVEDTVRSKYDAIRREYEEKYRVKQPTTTTIGGGGGEDEKSADPSAPHSGSYIDV